MEVSPGWGKRGLVGWCVRRSEGADWESPRHSPHAQNAGAVYPRLFLLAYAVPIPDLTTQGAGKSWLSAIGSGGHDWARDISESVPPCCRRSRTPALPRAWMTGDWRLAVQSWCVERRAPHPQT